MYEEDMARATQQMLDADLQFPQEQKCRHEYAYSDLHREFVCKKCFHVLTTEEKQEALEFANAMRRREEAIAQREKESEK